MNESKTRNQRSGGSKQYGQFRNFASDHLPGTITFQAGKYGHIRWDLDPD